MDSAISWERRFDRVAGTLQWVALAFGMILSWFQGPRSVALVVATCTAGAYVALNQGASHRYRWARWSGEMLVVVGVGATTVAIALTGGTSSPYLLLSATPVLYASLFFGWREGGETAALASGTLLALRGLFETQTLIDSQLLAWIGLYGLIAVTFGYARRLLLEAGALAQASGLEQDRLARLEAAHGLLTRLASLADGTELNPVAMGEAALDGIAARVDYSAATVILQGRDGPVVVAQRGDPTAGAQQLVTTLTVRGREVGSITLERAREFSPQERALAEQALAPVSLAFDNVLLLQDIARRAVAEERIRLARDLHDEIGPSLASLGLALDLAVIQHPDSPGLTGQLESMRQSVSHLVTDVRHTVADLRVAHSVSLRQQATALAASVAPGGPPVTIDLTEHRPPRPALGPDLAAIMTEAFRNALRHSGAGRVWIEGHVNYDEGWVRVRDDGAGFDHTSVPAGHYGLIGMDERAAAIGGRLEMESSPAGTAVTVTWRRA